MTAPRTILHLHIPRTSGSSAHAALFQYDQRHNRTIHAGSREAMRLQQEQMGGEPLLVTGHYAFGIHDLFSNPLYFIVLRDPVERCWSFIRFVLANSAHKRHEFFSSLKGDLTQIYRGPKFQQLHNGMVRQLNANIDAGDVEERHLEEAWQTLTRPDTVVAFSENLREGFERLGKQIDFSFSAPPTINAAPPAELPEDLRAAVEEHNALDRRLFIRAMDRWG